LIYISTGGIRDLAAWKTAEQFLEHGITAIELSGGKFDDEQLSHLKAMRSQAALQVHNYFPPSAKPFVFNLASLDEEVAKQGLHHVETAMQWALDLERPVYSFHAGFLLDPFVSELGKKISSRQLFDRTQAMEMFLERVNKLAETARQWGVSLLIENNVLSSNNYKEFAADPFLMTTAEECMIVMQNTPDNVNLLVDVAHLKVTANTLQFDPTKFLQHCHDWIKAYHLSDNEGTSDSNEPVTADSWFWPHLKPHLDYYSMEIYNVSISMLVQQHTMACQQLVTTDAVA